MFNTHGLDRGFLQREGIARIQAAIFAMRDDARNLFAAAVARMEGVGFTIALAHDPLSARVYEQNGIDAVVDPLLVTAEEIVRFAHDPRTQQMAMLEGDRFMVLDLTTRAESELVGVPIREMPSRGALIGAILRNGEAIFPHGERHAAARRPGDRLHGDGARARGRARAVTSSPPSAGGRGSASTSRARSTSSARWSGTSASRPWCRRSSRSPTTSRCGRSSPRGRW